jgi:integrase
VNAARRNHKRRDWPPRLYEPRPGYYVWRHPDGRVFPIGRVALAFAKAEAMSANQQLSDTRPSLAERIAGQDRTVAQLLEKMPRSDNKNTAKSRRSLDKKIAAALGSVACGQVTVRDVAELVARETEAGRLRSGQALRARMVDVFTHAVELGWSESNPASVTRAPTVKVKRGRLTLETFLQVYAKAAEVAEWLPMAMRLALITGADRSTIAGLHRNMVDAEWLTFARSKTGARVAIPLRIRLDVVGWTLADELKRRTGVVSGYFVHHINPWNNAPAGSKVHPDRISHAFTEARKLAGIADDGAPTFHEIRSLSKRLYEAQGGVDTQALLGHADEKTARLYADPRGIEPIRVRVA